MTIQRDDPNHDDLPRGAFVYQSLRESLRFGEFKAGQKIREVDICRRFNVSRTPVREALKLLHADGFLTAAPGGRLAVAGVNLDQAEEIYEMRETVEGLAARLAARKAKTADIVELSKIIDEQMKCAGDNNKLLRANDKFHVKIYEISRNRYIMKTADLLLNSIGMIRIATSDRFSYSEESCKQHCQIFSAIERGDTQGAEDAARHHIREGRRTRIMLLMEIEAVKGREP